MTNQPSKNDSNNQQATPASQQETVPSYDYSHLREKKHDGHWYSTPPLENSNPPPLDALSAVTQVSSQHQAKSSVPPIANPIPAPLMPQHEPPLPRDTNVRQRINSRQQRRNNGRSDNWVWVIIASTLLGVTVIASVLLVFIVRYATRDSGNEDVVALVDVPQIEPTSIIYSDGTGTEGGALEGNSLEIETRRWDGSERFTILLMGLDKRPEEDGAYFRTDSMMLISFDPINNSIGVLSIPRDLYVEVPFEGLHRINAAYVLGELQAPGNGPTLAKQTVQYNFGIRVNEYATIDFNTFIAIIDAIGGVEIEVPRNITDYNYPTMDYGTEVFQVSAGWQTMNGETALKYARTRHDSDDIDRASRQQQVLYAVRDKVTSLGIIDDLLPQAPLLYAELRNGIDTGLSFDQIVSLAIWASEVPRENIKSGVVGWEYLSGYQTPTGGSVVIPNRYRIGDLMVQVFGESYSQ